MSEEKKFTNTVRHISWTELEAGNVFGWGGFYAGTLIY